MNWTAIEIRQLRYRLGWSQAEMARCLKLELSQVSSIEAGRTLLPIEHRSSLLQIMNQAESNAERVQRVPIAEVMMKDLGLSQIHDFEVQTRSNEKI
ncbi:MAG: helix-turn-helix transcriptional regulator [Bdellovibrionota bacterium]